MFNENLAAPTVVEDSSPASAASPRSPYILYVIILLIVLVLAGVVGWGIYTRFFSTQQYSITTTDGTEALPVPTPMPRPFTNGIVHFGLTVPAGWMIQPAGHDTTGAAGAEAARIIELFDPFLGLDKALVMITSVQNIPSEDQARLTARTYNGLPAQYLETTNSFGTQERVYYIPHTPGNFVRVMVRSNGDPGLERVLQEIEESFVLTE